MLNAWRTHSEANAEKSDIPVVFSRKKKIIYDKYNYEWK
jgi:hypothetical protein